MRFDEEPANGNVPRSLDHPLCSSPEARADGLMRVDVDSPAAPTVDHLFVVEGDGAFPIDLLRQEKCWPARRQDAVAITMSVDRATPAPWRQVVLATHNQDAPSLRRWRNKGWRVII